MPRFVAQHEEQLDNEQNARAWHEGLDDGPAQAKGRVAFLPGVDYDQSRDCLTDCSSLRCQRDPGNNPEQENNHAEAQDGIGRRPVETCPAVKSARSGLAGPGCWNPSG